MGGLVGLAALVGLGVWFLRRKRASGGPDYKAAPSVEDRSEVGAGAGAAAGRYSGYGVGGMGGGGYEGGYSDERPPSNEGGIPMKYYVRLIFPLHVSRHSAHSLTMVFILLT